jgi:hypothetical protein
LRLSVRLLGVFGSRNDLLPERLLVEELRVRLRAAVASEQGGRRGGRYMSWSPGEESEGLESVQQQRWIERQRCQHLKEFGLVCGGSQETKKGGGGGTWRGGRSSP